MCLSPSVVLTAVFSSLWARKHLFHDECQTQSTTGPDLGLRCLGVAITKTNTIDCCELGHIANTEGGQGDHKASEEIEREGGVWFVDEHICNCLVDEVGRRGTVCYLG